MTDMLTAALDYAALGKPVFPCSNTPNNEDTHKSPLVKHGFYAATTDATTIKQWWRRWPNALIGMPTGEASGITVLDLDVKKGKNGYAAVPDWETRSHVIAKTGSGGAHLYFNAADAPHSTKDAIALGVDTRGTGGYVIVPPSPGYSWLNGSDLSSLPPWPADLRPPDLRLARPEATAPLPDWLMQLLKTDPGGGLSNDPADLPPPLDLPTIKAALAVIDPDIERKEWIAIGCALYKHLGHDEGFAIWDEWSSDGSKYSPRRMNSEWRSIAAKDGYDYNIGTLIYHANETDPRWRSRIEPDDAASVEEGHPIDEPPPRDQGDTKTDAKPETKTEPKPASIEPDAGALIISSRKFISDFKPPDYLIEGLLQRRFLYSMTGQTNAGKTTVALRLAAQVAEGLPLGDREIEAGKVLFFAGENPDDVRMRWIKLCEEMKISPETDQVFWVSGVYSIRKLRKVIDTQTTQCGPFALIIIDSAAAYFEGEDENSNTQLGAYARMLRTLVEIYGGPTILVLSHPVKNANPDSLLPRGGGAFLNEVDGNLVLMTASEAPKVVDLHWHGKFRGPDFSPISFALTAGTSERIKDSKGRPIWTVTARMLTTAERAATEDRGQANRNKLIGAMKAKEGATLVELARYCGWFYKKGEPNTSLANRTMHDCEAQRLVKKEGGRWKLTKAGLATDTVSI
ncbi:bifunctional DNA primase/polymerase [Bradyrhizobium diazoefficiens]